MAGMVVQHNLNAINANNKMNINVSGTKKATEKLSSGYQINRAGDNAAGLAISEKNAFTDPWSFTGYKECQRRYLSYPDS